MHKSQKFVVVNTLKKIKWINKNNYVLFKFSWCKKKKPKAYKFWLKKKISIIYNIYVYCFIINLYKWSFIYLQLNILCKKR